MRIYGCIYGWSGLIKMYIILNKWIPYIEVKNLIIQFKSLDILIQHVIVNLIYTYIYNNTIVRFLFTF